MSSNMAPVLVRSASDLVEYQTDDARSAHGQRAKGLFEEKIHSELMSSMQR